MLIFSMSKFFHIVIL